MLQMIMFIMITTFLSGIVGSCNQQRIGQFYKHGLQSLIVTEVHSEVSMLHPTDEVWRRSSSIEVDLFLPASCSWEVVFCDKVKIIEPSGSGKLNLAQLFYIYWQWHC